MKQVLISEDLPRFKANLHAHSICSDGRWTPADLKKLYKDAGYSILALSDHNVLVDHSELNDPDFFMLPACEINISRKGELPAPYYPCYHFNVYPRKPGNFTLPCYNPKYIWTKETAYRDAQSYLGSADYIRDYDHTNEMVREFLQNDFLVMLNHPTWSQQTTADFLQIDGFFAMEIYNHGCVVEGYDEINSRVFDELLRAGRHVFCVASDDNHNAFAPDHPRFDSLGGFTVIQAESLTQEAIIAALEAGRFYSSTAPLIHSLILEDNTLSIRTSPAAKIVLSTGIRQSRVAYPEHPGGTLTEATFNLANIHPTYLRVTVFDSCGNQAWSQPIWRA